MTKLSVNIRHKRRSNRDIDERWLIVDKSFHFVFPCDNPAAWYKVENDTKDHRLLIVRKDALEYPNVCSEENSETLALTIKNVNKTCAGEYECRDPTTPVDVKVRLHIQIKGELGFPSVSFTVTSIRELTTACSQARNSTQPRLTESFLLNKKESECVVKQDLPISPIRGGINSMDTNNW